jgi:glycosyltransferase involved in cell wall biosynthesis
MAGVEKTVLLLLSKINRDKFTPRVIINGYGPFHDALIEQGEEVEVLNSSAGFAPSFAFKLRTSLEKRHANVVQLHLSRFNAPFIHSTGAKVVERLNMTRHSSALYLMRNRAIDILTTKWIDEFIVVSDSLKTQFIERGYPPEKLSRIYNGIEVSTNMNPGKLRAELSVPGHTPLIGAVGRLTRQKGMDTALRAFAIIAEKLPTAKFAVAGDGELRSDLNHLAKELKLSDKLSFLGFRDDPLDVIASFDVLFYPSRWEPFANTILEAMAVGTPVVASNVGGNAEAIRDGETGLLVPVDDPEESAGAILNALNDRQRLLNFAEAAMRDVKKYSVENMVAGHERVYERLASIS